MSFEELLYDKRDGIGALGMASLALGSGTEEAIEGRNAFLEKRKPDFRKCREPR